MIHRKSGQVTASEFVSEIKTVDEEKRTIVHTITNSVIDRYEEIVDPAGMDDKNYNGNPVVLFGHNSGGWGITDVSTIPIIGRSQWRKREGESIISKTEFTDATDFAEDAWNLARKGFMKAVSIGFMAKAHEAKKLSDIKDLNPSNRADHDANAEMWIWRKWELLEYSLVPIPANPEALQNALTEVRSVRMLKYLEALREKQALCELEACKADMEHKIGEVLARFPDLSTEEGRQRFKALLPKTSDEMKIEVPELKVVLEQIEQLKAEIESLKQQPVGTLAAPVSVGDIARNAARREVSRAKGRIIND